MKDGDFTLDLYGWKEAGNQFDSLYKADVAQHLMPVHAPIIINKWFPAAHIDFYIARKTGQHTYGMGSLFDLHQYSLSNRHKPFIQKGSAAYYIVPSNLYDEETINYINKMFDVSLPPVTLAQKRGGVDCKKLYVYRLKGYN